MIRLLSANFICKYMHLNLGGPIWVVINAMLVSITSNAAQ